jgi:hypothetical protein
MFIQTPTPIPVTQTIMQQITPYLVAFLIICLAAAGLVVKSWATNLAAKLAANHATQLATAAKVDTIETHTNGMLTALQGKVDAQDLAAKNLADITARDKQIADLTPKPPQP